MPKSENVDWEIDESQLPPLLQQLLEGLKADRKGLLKDKAYTDPVQLRAFVAQYMFARMSEIVKVFGQAFVDTYGLAVSTAEQQEKLRRVVVRELELDDRDDDAPGVSTKTLDEFQHHLYALGAILAKELPDHKGAQDAYNACAELIDDMVAELLGEEPDDREDDESAAEPAVEAEAAKPEEPLEPTLEKQPEVD